MDKSITICLHAQEGLQHIVDAQKQALAPLENVFDIEWNLRIERHPGKYDSYSELINDAVITSSNEYIVMLNARVKPQPQEVIHMLTLLENGYAMAGKHNVAYMAVTKELFRKTGWWDERYLGGGFEDDEFYLRMHLANLAIYDSHECVYDFTWKQYHGVEGGDKCALSEPHFFRKWRVMDTKIIKALPEENYKKYDGCLGDPRPDISSKWQPWNKSVIGSGYGTHGDRDGIPQGRKITEFHGYPRSHRFCIVHYAGMAVGQNKEVIDGTKEDFNLQL